MDGAVHLAEVAGAPTVERALDAVREFLDMEVAFVGEISHEHEIYRYVRGKAESFGFTESESLPLNQTYCQRVLDGRLPNLISDVRADDRAASLAITRSADIGAFVSIPLSFSGGRLYGMLCAADHHAKPGLGYRELQFLNVFARMVSDVLEREALQRQMRESQQQAAAVNALLAAVDSRDSYTCSHSLAVVNHGVAVARKLGLDHAEIADVRNVTILHDIGKIATPDAVLHKPGPLDDSEWKIMRNHSIAGAELLSQVPSLRHLCPAIRAEHERWDGTGYPDGLAGTDIPLASRITLVCDAYHAMTSDRPYRQALGDAQAQQEIRAGSGSQFCPKAAAALLSTLNTTH